MESTVHGLCEEEEEEKKGANYRCLTELQVAGEVDFLKWILRNVASRSFYFSFNTVKKFEWKSVIKHFEISLNYLKRIKR